MTQQELRAARVQRHGEEAVRKLENACVGIAGLGGLGSHLAISLVRMGVGTLVLVDFDRVDVTNLHRQQYFASQVGLLKTEALAQTLKAIDPWVELKLYPVRLTSETIPTIFDSCPVLCEAFDSAEEKAMLLETALGGMPDTMVVSASGMAGVGSANQIQTRRALSRLYLCGDGEADVAEYGSLFASRVAVCAAHQAQMVLRLILGETEP